MPEGPQVARYARLQSEKLVGKTVHADSPNGRADEVAALIDGATLRGIEAIGKHLLYDFGDERYLHVHLGRFGSFREGTMPLLEPQGVLRFRFFTDCDWFELRGAIAIDIFDASMRELLDNRIGPNPLDAKADSKRAFAKIVKSKTSIGSLLMDQTIVAGVGNIYRSEVLFLGRINPRRAGTSLDLKTWRGIWKDLARLMVDGAKTGRIVTTYPRDRARPKGLVRSDDRFYVYRRTGLPCRSCGTLIRTGLIGNRSVFWCPHDQPEVLHAAVPKTSRGVNAGTTPANARTTTRKIARKKR